jgi:hypothetical protein
MVGDVAARMVRVAMEGEQLEKLPLRFSEVIAKHFLSM